MKVKIRIVYEEEYEPDLKYYARADQKDSEVTIEDIRRIDKQNFIESPATFLNNAAAEITFTEIKD